MYRGGRGWGAGSAEFENIWSKIKAEMRSNICDKIIINFYLLSRKRARRKDKKTMKTKKIREGQEGSADGPEQAGLID